MGLLRMLLAWDRQRIADARRAMPRVDRSDYEARQARAEAALELPPAAWSQEVREHFQVLVERAGVEAMGSAAPAVEVKRGGRARARLGQARSLRPMLAPSGENALRAVAAAAEIGVLDLLQRCGEPAWRNVKGL